MTTQLTLFDYNALDTETRIVVQQRTTEIKALMKRAASDIIEIGQKLIDVKARLGHGQFTGWLRSEFDWSQDTATNFMRVARRFGDNPKISEFAPSALYLLAAPSTPEGARIEALTRAEEGEPITYSKAQEIVGEHKYRPRMCPYCGYSYNAGDQPDGDVTTCPACKNLHIYSGPRDTEKYGPYTDEQLPFDAEAEHRLQVISGLEPRRTAANFTSASNEWYTPAEYVEAAREVMGDIDLDPASNATAQQTINAMQWCGLDHPDPEQRNGLTAPWHGRVWLNPPYGADAGESSSGVWAARLIEQYDDGVVTDAVLLVNAVTDRKWFQQLWRFPICFTDHRIKFYTPDGTPQQPVNGNALVYMGDNIAEFVRVFSRFGAVVNRLHVYDNVVYAEVEDASAR